jgi:uncharacterized protein (UPF0335 family)
LNESGPDSSRPGIDLEEHLKQLMQQLGHAINESLSESEAIAEVIGDIKREGYDVYLVLEATIGFNKRDENDEPSEDVDGDYSFSEQDQAFLRALKIAAPEE